MSDPMPTTWPELIAHLDGMPRSHGANYAYFMEQTRGKKAGDPELSASLFRASEALARAVVMGLGQHIAPALAVLQKRAAETAELDTSIAKQMPMANLSALTAAAVAEASRHGSWDDMVARILPRFSTREPAKSATDQQVTWACLAWGDKATAQRMLEGADIANPVLKIQSHIVSVLKDDDVFEAGKWLDYLDQFPALLADNQVTWNELIWAGRAVHSTVLGLPPEDLQSWLRAEIDTL